MIPLALVNEVRRLLALKFSQREIVRLVGVSRGTIAGIASGTRPDYSLRQAGEPDPLQPTAPPERCPTCGGMVYMPCRLCQVRSLPPPKATLAERIFADLELDFQLKDEHRARYEQVRAQREKSFSGE
ncbi:MAG: hypothetical protein ABSG68_05485 [Thermoguttaceae bacterium]|jgi:transcriptional regulator with XRE-family HTH domain